MPELRYRVGIDVGLNSVGLAAVEVDEEGWPIRILCMESVVHDSGVDPTANKTAGTRKAVSGAARRMRRLIRQRRARLHDLDRALQRLGWPIVDLETIRDPRFPWKARRRLATEKIGDDSELKLLLSVAVRHIARHRGWRNPYVTVNSLKQQTEPSKYLTTLVESIGKRLGRDVDPSLTVAQIVDLAIRALPPKEAATLKIRGPEKKSKDGSAGPSGLLESKIHQSDNVRELRTIWQTQQLPEDLFNTVVDKVFQARSPKGSAAGRVGKDPLPGMGKEPRAEKASLAFQHYRIASIVANLRIRTGAGERPLDAYERRQAVDRLWGATDDITWSDVADLLGIERRQLAGTAKETADGERASARPPINVTDERLHAAKIKELTIWWEDATEPDREALIEVISNGAGSGATAEQLSRAMEFVASLPEEVMGKLENVKLPEGRAAYSATSLRRLTHRLMTTTEDLHEARKAEFGVSDDWHPPAEPIAQPVGNPAVDRVLTIVGRWLAAAEREWGNPLSVNVEHTRDGLMSEKQAREVDRANNQRYQRNQEMRGEIAAYLADNRSLIAEGRDDSFDETSDDVLTAIPARDVDRWRAFTRQEGKCLYCGIELHYPVFEMDHIVPRAGQGATNMQVNFAAVCRDCNHSKGKQPFAVWAKSGLRPQVNQRDAIDRVRGFRFFGVEDRDWKYKKRFIREVVDRLQRTDLDDPIDNRSIESVGWMANELHHRIDEHFKAISPNAPVTVGVFRGWITSEARRAAGIDKRMLLIGGTAGKTRLDRRHHAVDAATIAMLRPGAAQVLAVRDNLHKTNRITPSEEVEWKQYKGADTALFDAWTSQMQLLADLVQAQLDQDRVPVFEFLRLKPGSSSGHKDTIRQTVKVRLGDALSKELIDRSATPQQWVALTRAPGFDPESGLDADLDRRIRIKDRWLGSADHVEFFPTGAGCIAVRGGYAELGSSFHHARIYRCTKPMKSGKDKVFYAMMRVYQIDLLSCRGKPVDLFSVEIPPQAISRRTAEERLKEALEDGRAEYIGWIVPGDELLLNMSSQTRGKVEVVLKSFPSTTRWVVDAFDQVAIITLRPRYLALEGLPGDADADARIVLTRGWRVSVGVLFASCDPVIVRRDILGRARVTSSAHLPVSWTAALPSHNGSGRKNNPHLGGNPGPMIS